jgi:hypothetical protein
MKEKNEKSGRAFVWLNRQECQQREKIKLLKDRSNYMGRQNMVKKCREGGVFIRILWVQKF